MNLYWLGPLDGLFTDPKIDKVDGYNWPIPMNMVKTRDKLYKNIYRHDVIKVSTSGTGQWGQLPPQESQIKYYS